MPAFAADGAEPIKLISYNLRNSHGKDGDNVWMKRRHATPDERSQNIKIQTYPGAAPNAHRPEGASAQVRRGFGVSCEYTHETLQTETISRR